MRENCGLFWMDRVKVRNMIWVVKASNSNVERNLNMRWSLQNISRVVEEKPVVVCCVDVSEQVYSFSYCVG